MPSSAASGANAHCYTRCASTTMRLRQVLLRAQWFEMSRIPVAEATLDRKTRASLSQESGQGKAPMRLQAEPIFIRTRLMHSASVQ